MDDVTLMPDQEVAIGLPLSGYRLIPGYQGMLGLPVEAYLRLYAVNDQGDRRLIADPGDVSPLVERIGSEEDAWRFLRLFTAPATHYLFQKQTSTVDLDAPAPGQPAGIGSISPEVARRIGYQPPEMRLENREYLATRMLVRASAGAGGGATVLRRREAVGVDGSYRLIADEEVAQLDRGEVVLPMYE